MNNIWVVCASDFPHSVFSSEKAAEEAIRILMAREVELYELGGKGPTYYHLRGSFVLDSAQAALGETKRW